jgi:hypothetical protein
LRRRIPIGLAVTVMLASALVAGPASAAPSERASEIGHCSAAFAKAGERNVIAHIIRDDAEPPGIFYREVARLKGSEACPAE